MSETVSVVLAVVIATVGGNVHPKQDRDDQVSNGLRWVFLGLAIGYTVLEASLLLFCEREAVRHGLERIWTTALVYCRARTRSVLNLVSTGWNKAVQTVGTCLSHVFGAAGTCFGLLREAGNRLWVKWERLRDTIFPPA